MLVVADVFDCIANPTLIEEIIVSSWVKVLPHSDFWFNFFPKFEFTFRFTSVYISHIH